MDDNRVCRHHLRGHCNLGDECKFQHPPMRASSDFIPSKPCWHYQKGYCKLGDKCSFLHPKPMLIQQSQVPTVRSYVSVLIGSADVQTVAPELPIDILKQIFLRTYTKNLPFVCKYWLKTIKTLPLACFQFPDVLSGICFSGCAIAFARSKIDAVFLICKSRFDEKGISSDGSWYENRNSQKAPLIPKYLRQELLDADKRNIDQNKKAKDNSKACAMYHTLYKSSPIILSTNKPMGFYCGGGD
jgi:hypothetical protein